LPWSEPLWLEPTVLACSSRSGLNSLRRSCWRTNNRVRLRLAGQMRAARNS
jgi:hypothetical protein